MQLFVYSRTVLDDAGTLSRYEYNGSFGVLDVDCASLDDATPEQMEGWAKMMDCFYDVIFVDHRHNARQYTMEGYQ